MKEHTEKFNHATQDYNTPQAMKDVWAVSLEMAQKLIEVCQRHGLKCWMDSGTLLGAIRHKSFIPWDDDIDFVMLRKDYDKLASIAQQEFKEPYFFQTTLSDDDFCCGHAILRRTDTTAMSESEVDKNYCRGIGLDIFVLDGFIENPVLRFLHRTFTMVIKKTIRGNVRRLGEKHSLGKKLVGILSKGIYSWVSYKKAFKLYEKMFRAIDEDTHRRVSVISYRYSTRKRIRLRSSYTEQKWIPFEGILLPAPNGWEDALICYFGEDYMTPRQLPTMHGQKYMDAHRDYKSVARELKAHPENYSERIKLLYNE